MLIRRTRGLSALRLISGSVGSNTLPKLVAWHISELKIYDQPRELRGFTGLQSTRFGMRSVKITCPPQSWRYVEDNE